MIDAGALENVEAIFGLHVNPNFPLGEVSSRSGPFLAGSGFFEAVISGRGGHAAIPQHSIDPILAASNVIVSLQHLVSREADPLDSQVYFSPHALPLPQGISLAYHRKILICFCDQTPMLHWILHAVATSHYQEVALFELHDKFSEIFHGFAP